MTKWKYSRKELAREYGGGVNDLGFVADLLAKAPTPQPKEEPKVWKTMRRIIDNQWAEDLQDSKPKKEKKEIFISEFSLGDKGFLGGINIEIERNGTITRRKGYTTFGEMVHVLWEINRKAKKGGWSSEYTVKLPLKGNKPVYKKTLNL